MPARGARKGWRGRLTDDEANVLLMGDMFDRVEDVFPTTDALVAAWYAHRNDLMAEWDAGDTIYTRLGTRPYGWWIAESPTGERPLYYDEPEVLRRILKNERRRAAAAAKKETPK